MSVHPDVLIIGGGVIGLTTALYLAQEGVTTHIVERGEFGQESSWAGAGILSPAPPLARARGPFEQLLALSAGEFPTLSEQLRERGGLDNGYLACGGLELLDSDPAFAVRAWRESGITCEELAGDAVRALEPALNAGRRRVVHFPGMAQLRNPRHLKALLASCVTLGVGLRGGCPVMGFERDGQRVTAALTPEGRICAGQFVVAGGAWSDSLLSGLGWSVPIRPVRGQIALLQSRGPVIRRIVEVGKQYLVPRPDGRTLVGSTEEEVGFDKRTTADAIAGLLALALELVPALRTAAVERCWAGLRPGSPDGLPFLGRVPGCDNVWVGAGHFRSGIQLSPGTALVLRELLLGHQPPIALEAFRLDRPIARHNP